MKITKSLLTVLLFGMGFSTQAQQGVGKETARYEAQGISLRSYDFKGLEPMLHQSNDTTYVVNFWATWCQPCVAELPHFEKINKEYAGKKVKVLLVSLDMKKQVPDALAAFMVKRNIQSKVLHLSDPDANAWIPNVDANWSGALPGTLMYRNSKRAFFEQSFEYPELQKQLLAFLNP